MDLQSFKHADWTKVWAGNWGLLSCSYFGSAFTRFLRFGGKPFMSKAVIFVANGKSECWILQADRDTTGKELAQEVTTNPGKASEICSTLKKEADEIVRFIDALSGKKITQQDFQDFWQQVTKYYHPHVFVKYVVDYLPLELLQRHLSRFEEARVYSEPVFKRTEEFVVGLADFVSQKTQMRVELILNLTIDEMEEYLSSGKLPGSELLAERDQNSALIFDASGYEIFTEKVAKNIESSVQDAFADMLRGTTAFPGVVQGTVRVILDTSQDSHFAVGDVLVTGMTRPEYLPLMKKAAAIVTDAGGILSHAAIVAREMKKPCVIGTQVATKVFKNGDMVEVDGEKGIVRKLN